MKTVLPKHLTDVEALELIWGPPEIIRSEVDLRDYQVWMADTACKQDGVFLAAEMGLGKTAACLLAATRLLERGEVTQVLIVAPLRVAEETWPEEIAKWAFARHLRYRIVVGTAEERLAALDYGPCEVTIVNRENLHWLYDQIGARNWPFDLCIYDEASRLGSGRKKTKPTKRKDGTVGTPRTTELGILSQVRHKMRVIELSGTPAPKGLINLWGPIYLIDKGYRLGRNKTDFEKRWFSTSRWSYEPTPHEHSEAEIMDAIKDVFFSLKEEDYLKLPPLIVQDHKVVLPEPIMAQYRKFERDSAIWVRDGARDPEVIKAVNEGVLTGKLLQFANGSLYREDGSDVKVHDKKLDVLSSIVEEAGGNPILCAYSFQFDRAAIKKRFPWVRIFGETPNDMRDWNAGRIRMLLTHPASAGHGLNFQFSSNIAVWYGLTWSAELYSQFIKRLHRSGQKQDRVFLHRILARGTMDESVVRVLGNRQLTQDRITSAVRVRLASALTGGPEYEEEAEALI